MQARIRVFGITESSTLQNILSYYSGTGSQHQGWMLEYRDAQSLKPPALESSALTDIDLFVRATYEIEDIAKLHKESMDGSSLISHADIFLQKSLLYCYHAAAVVENQNANDSRFAKSVNEAEITLRALVASLGLEPSLSISHVSLKGAPSLPYQQDLRTLVRLTGPDVISCSRLGSDLLLARHMMDGCERYVFISRREDHAVIDDISPYHLLLARRATRHIINLYKELYTNIAASNILIPPNGTKGYSNLLRLAEARQELVRTSNLMHNLSTKNAVLLLFIGRASFFNPSLILLCHSADGFNRAALCFR